MNLGSITGFLTALSTFGSLILALYLFWKTNNRLDEFSGIADSARQFLRFEKDEGGNVLLDARLAGMIKALSSGLAQSMKMSMLGSLSGPARLDKGLKGAIAADVVDQKMPMLNLVGDFLGFNTKKYITKHPEAMMQLYGMVAPALGKMKMGVPGANPGSGNDGVGYG